MAVGKKCSSKSRRGGCSNTSNADATDGGLGIVHCTRSMGRKRVLVSYCSEPLSTFRTPLKKRNKRRRCSEKSLLEALPQEILVQVLCGVNHDDLKKLFHVSKTIREATLIAKEWHFEYSTPSSKPAAVSKFDSPEMPNASKQRRRVSRPKIDRQKKLADITVALFTMQDEESWLRNELLMETEI